MSNHYKILGLAKNATKPQIKQAFRQLALKFHPDKHTTSPPSVRNDARRRYAQLSQAYEVLSDDCRRAIYDQRLRDGGDENVSRRARGGATGSYTVIVDDDGETVFRESDTDFYYRNRRRDRDRSESETLFYYRYGRKAVDRRWEWEAGVEGRSGVKRKDSDLGSVLGDLIVQGLVWAAKSLWKVYVGKHSGSGRIGSGKSTEILKKLYERVKKK